MSSLDFFFRLLAAVAIPAVAIGLSGGTTRPASAVSYEDRVMVDAGVHRHCWHPSSNQHSVMTGPCTEHLDSYCCFCRKQKCETLGTPCYPDCSKHGPYFDDLHCELERWKQRDGGYSTIQGGAR